MPGSSHSTVGCFAQAIYPHTLLAAILQNKSQGFAEEDERETAVWLSTTRRESECWPKASLALPTTIWARNRSTNI